MSDNLGNLNISLGLTADGSIYQTSQDFIRTLSRIGQAADHLQTNMDKHFAKLSAKFAHLPKDAKGAQMEFEAFKFFKMDRVSKDFLKLETQYTKLMNNLSRAGASKSLGGEVAADYNKLVDIFQRLKKASSSREISNLSRQFDLVSASLRSTMSLTGDAIKDTKEYEKRLKELSKAKQKQARSDDLLRTKAAVAKLGPQPSTLKAKDTGFAALLRAEEAIAKKAQSENILRTKAAIAQLTSSPSTLKAKNTLFAEMMRDEDALAKKREKNDAALLNNRAKARFKAFKAEAKAVEAQARSENLLRTKAAVARLSPTHSTLKAKDTAFAEMLKAEDVIAKKRERNESALIIKRANAHLKAFKKEESDAHALIRHRANAHLKALKAEEKAREAKTRNENILRTKAAIERLTPPRSTLRARDTAFAEMLRTENVLAIKRQKDDEALLRNRANARFKAFKKEESDSEALIRNRANAHLKAFRKEEKDYGTSLMDRAKMHAANMKLQEQREGDMLMARARMHASVIKRQEKEEGDMLMERARMHAAAYKKEEQQAIRAAETINKRKAHSSQVFHSKLSTGLIGIDVTGQSSLGKLISEIGYARVAAVGLANALRLVVKYSAKLTWWLVKLPFRAVYHGFSLMWKGLNLFRQALFNVKMLIATGGFLYGLKQIVETSAKFEGMEAGLLAITGSAEESGKAFQWLIAQSRRLGVSVETLNKQFVDIKAAIGDSMDDKTFKKIFLSVAEASRVLQSSDDQVKRGFLAIQQMLSKGTVQAEELKRQMAEAIPGSFQMAADAWAKLKGHTGLSQLEKSGALIRALDLGIVKSMTLLPLLADEIIKKYGGGLAAAVTKAKAEFQRFENEVLLFKKAIGEAGVLDVVKDWVAVFHKTIRGFTQIIENNRERISKALKDMIGVDAILGFSSSDDDKINERTKKIVEAIIKFGDFAVQVYDKVSFSINNLIDALQVRLPIALRGLARLIQAIIPFGEAIARKIGEVLDTAFQRYAGQDALLKLKDDLAEIDSQIEKVKKKKADKSLMSGLADAPKTLPGVFMWAAEGGFMNNRDEELDEQLKRLEERRRDLSALLSTTLIKQLEPFETQLKQMRTINAGIESLSEKLRELESNPPKPLNEDRAESDKGDRRAQNNIRRRRTEIKLHEQEVKRIKDALEVLRKEYAAIQKTITIGPANRDNPFAALLKDLGIAFSNTTESAADQGKEFIAYSHNVGKGLDTVLEKFRELTQSFSDSRRIFQDMFFNGEVSANALEISLKQAVEKNKFVSQMKGLGQAGMVEFAESMKISLKKATGISGIAKLDEEQLKSFMHHYNRYAEGIRIVNESLEEGEKQHTTLNLQEFFDEQGFRSFELTTNQSAALMKYLTDEHMKMVTAISSKSAAGDIVKTFDDMNVKIAAWNKSGGNMEVYERLVAEANAFKQASLEVNKLTVGSLEFKVVASEVAETLRNLGFSNTNAATTAKELAEQIAKAELAVGKFKDKTKEMLSASGMIGSFFTEFQKKFDFVEALGLDTTRVNAALEGIDYIVSGISDYTSQMRSMYEQMASAAQQAAQQALSSGREQASMYMQLADAVRYTNHEQAKMYEQKAIAAEESARREYDAQQLLRAKHNDEAKKAFENEKRMKKLQIIMSTSVAMMKAWEAGPIVGPALAGFILALGSAQASLVDKQQFTPREKGGSITGGKPYLVGEAGPELIVPGRGGTVVNNDDLMDGIGGGDIIVNFNIQAADASGFDRLLASRRGMIINMIRDATNSQMRRSPV